MSGATPRPFDSAIGGAETAITWDGIEQAAAAIDRLNKRLRAEHDALVAVESAAREAVAYYDEFIRQPDRIGDEVAPLRAALARLDDARGQT